MPILAARREPTTRRFRAFAQIFVEAEKRRQAAMPPKIEKVGINFLGRFGHESHAVEKGSRAHSIFLNLKKVESELLVLQSRGQQIPRGLIDQRKALLTSLYSELKTQKKP